MPKAKTEIEIGTEEERSGVRGREREEGENGEARMKIRGIR